LLSVMGLPMCTLFVMSVCLNTLISSVSAPQKRSQTGTQKWGVSVGLRECGPREPDYVKFRNGLWRRYVF
jgi:hypothetical protein